MTVASGCVFRYVRRVLRSCLPIEATGAAEAYRFLPDDTLNELNNLGECPL